jgi:antitoxin (DNA-binding transcriptional repressor) of toxin-antitoxin stability system
MTAAAHAEEYEVPPHGAAPAEAIEAAESGQIVYLTRLGRRIATIEPAQLHLAQLQRRAEEAKEVEEHTARMCRVMWDGLVAIDESTRQEVRDLLDKAMALAEDMADKAAVEAALADPAPAIPAEQIWTDLGIGDEP